MRYESEHGEPHDDLHGDLHGAFDAAVMTLTIGASPTATVMHDGAVRRTRRRLAVTSGVAVLAVLPIAAVAVFAGGGGAKGAVNGAVNTAAHPTPSPASSPSPSRSGSGTGAESPNPPPIVVPTPLPAPGTLNHDLPNDNIVVLASGTVDGKPWRLVRDRYVVAGPESDNVMDDPSSRPHLPYAANWNKPGAIECDFTGVQWGAGAPGGREGGGACGPADKGSISAITGRFDGGSYEAASSAQPSYIEGRIDGTDAAYAVVTVDSWSSGKLPLIEIPGEQNAYFVAQLAKAPTAYQSIVETVYDAHGRSLGSQQMLDTSFRGKTGQGPGPGAKK